MLRTGTGDRGHGPLPAKAKCHLLSALRTSPGIFPRKPQKHHHGGSDMRASWRHMPGTHHRLGRVVAKNVELEPCIRKQSDQSKSRDTLKNNRPGLFKKHRCPKRFFFLNASSVQDLKRSEGHDNSVTYDP